MGKVLSVSGLKKSYQVKKRIFSYRDEQILALDDVSFELDEGKTLGIVGESGSGKSTLARCVTLLERADHGRVIFSGVDLTALKGNLPVQIRRSIQMIFQDPYSSLNPRRTVFHTIAEPLLFHRIVRKKDLKERVIKVAHDMGLDKETLYRYPHQLSGGQRQRVAIARALAPDPVLLVADEPVSALDVSIQAQIINLFLDIKEGIELSMAFISHDLNVVRFVSDEIVVMYRGRVVESGSKDAIFKMPLHPYTEMLLQAVKGELTKRQLTSEDQDHEGCIYFHRCEKRERQCSLTRPDLKGDMTHQVACHLI